MSFWKSRARLPPEGKATLPPEVKRYTVKRAFPGWNPQKVIRQTEKKARKLMKRLQ